MSKQINWSANHSETWVWERFRKAWPWRCQRVDPNGGHNSGIPDVHLLDAHGKRGMLELKRPNKVVLRPSQWLWHEQDTEGGGVSCVLTCAGPTKDPKWRVYIIGIAVKKLFLCDDEEDTKSMISTVLHLLDLRK